MAGLRVELLPWERIRDQAIPIRTRVFVTEQAVSVDLEMDGRDRRCRHALALSGAGEAVGTGRLLPDGHLGRLAVLPAWRGQGVGIALIEALLRAAAEAGLEQVALNAQTHALPFYRRLGFQSRGAEFMEAGIPHVAMVRLL